MNSSPVSALELRDLHKIYPARKNTPRVEALRGINLAVAPGEFFGLLGPNGAGKSTTIGIVASLINKTAGSVKIFGIDVEEDPIGAKRLLGLVPQEINFNQFERPDQIVAQQAGYFGIPWRDAQDRAEQSLRVMGLWEKRSQPARNLSGGMKRRLLIARALVHGPRLLILDEPTAGVDIEIRRSTWKLLEDVNAGGTTIILTTHNLEEAESLCKRIAIIDHGAIVQDTDTRTLLSQLALETFVLDLDREVPAGLSLGRFVFRERDSHTIEVDVERGTTLNELFQVLAEANLEVASLRNKANRLEELFVRLVERNAS